MIERRRSYFGFDLETEIEAIEDRDSRPSCSRPPGTSSPRR